MRKLLAGLIATLTTLVLGAVAVDFGAAIYAEYRLARSVRTAAHLPFDPWASILSFPFIAQAAHHRYKEVEIRATGVDQAITGKVSLEATLHGVDLRDSSWLIGPDATLPVGKLESRIIIDSRHVGGDVMGIKDLQVEAPTAGVQRRHRQHHGVGHLQRRRSGVHRHAGRRRFRQAGQRLGRSHSRRPEPDHPGVHPPDQRAHRTRHRRSAVPQDHTAAVLAAFTSQVPGQKLPFGLTPTSAESADPTSLWKASPRE